MGCGAGARALAGPSVEEQPLEVVVEDENISDVDDPTMTAVRLLSSLGHQEAIPGFAIARFRDVRREAGFSTVYSIIALIQGYEAVLKDTSEQPSSKIVDELTKKVEESQKTLDSLTKDAAKSRQALASLENELETAKANKGG